MQVIAASFSAVFPLLCFMALGLMLGRIGLVTRETADILSSLVFRVFLPMSIIENIAGADLNGQFDLKCALFVGISCVCTYIFLEMRQRRRSDPDDIAPVIVQGIHKANYSLLVVPVVSAFYPRDLGMSAVLVAVITPIVNTCSTLSFVSRSDRKEPAGKLLSRIIRNPMVLSSLAGILLNLSGIRIPALLMNKVVDPLAGVATPLAMMALGASFEFGEMSSYRRELARVCTGKLILMPLVLCTAAALLGIRGADLIAVLVYSGAPTAVNSYSTAVSMGGNGTLAGQIVALSSALSILTLFCWLCALGALGLI
ncbi:MAG: AEC family transporter [Eubacteriaceae bacterium]|nr:AEC family transporter [Eubacteriaceae bacterium]